MMKAPLKLNWDDLLSTDNASPPPELEVLPSAAAGPAADGEALVSDMADHELHDKIQRILTHFSSGLACKLPDKGAKLRQNLRQHQAELDCRKLARYQKELPRGCTEDKQCRSADVSALHDVPSPNYTKSEPRHQPSFATFFPKKSKHKAKSASKEQSRFISRGKCCNLRDNKKQKHEDSRLNRMSLQPSRMPFGQSQFRSSSDVADRDMHISSNGDYRITEPSKVSYNLRMNYLAHSSKKRNASEIRGSLRPRSNKVERVVLLDEEEEQLTQSIHIDDAHDEWKEAKIYYPSRDDPESIELSYSDINCLDPREYLSSTVMNFYIRYLQRPLSPVDRTRGGYYFFNTYFYKKLEDAILCKGDRSASFLKLRRWWKGTNIFQKAYIFLPIHYESHWSLVIICIPTKEDDSGPVILHLDSLELHASKRILGIVDSCLKQEWNYINQNDPPPDVPFSEKTWKSLPRWIEKKKIVVPQQKNEYDCGLFVLYFMERFIEEAPKRLKKKDLSSMFGKQWFKPEDASDLRKRLRDLLVKEFENARLENGETGLPTCSSDSDT